MKNEMTTDHLERCKAIAERTGGKELAAAIGAAVARRSKYAPARELATTRRASEFTDASGAPVAVGDAVEASGVNDGLRGEVVGLNTNRRFKPFTVRLTDGSGLVVHFNREWTRKVTA